MGIRTVCLVGLLFAISWAPQEDDFLIRKSGETRFGPLGDRELEEGDTIRTTAELEFDYGASGSVWIGPQTDLLYGSGMSLEVLTGLVVAQAGTSDFDIQGPGVVVIVIAASAEIDVNENETTVLRIHPREGADGGDVYLEGDSGFTLWLDEDQSAILVYDYETGATRVIIPRENPGDVVGRLLDNKVSILGEVMTAADLYIGPTEIQIRPGGDILIQKADQKKLDEPPEGKPAGQVVGVTPGGLPLPTDEPFEDSGDILEVLNVSPSQP